MSNFGYNFMYLIGTFKANICVFDFVSSDGTVCIFVCCINFLINQFSYINYFNVRVFDLVHL